MRELTTSTARGALFHYAWGGSVSLHPFTEPLGCRAFARQPSGSV